ncbi:hypothetical protein CYMTET_45825, partial [Cymbomonas tetramitiformis]
MSQYQAPMGAFPGHASFGGILSLAFLLCSNRACHVAAFAALGSIPDFTSLDLNGDDCISRLEYTLYATSTASLAKLPELQPLVQGASATARAGTGNGGHVASSENCTATILRASVDAVAQKLGNPIAGSVPVARSGTGDKEDLQAAVASNIAAPRQERALLQYTQGTYGLRGSEKMVLVGGGGRGGSEGCWSGEDGKMVVRRSHEMLVGRWVRRECEMLVGRWGEEKCAVLVGALGEEEVRGAGRDAAICACPESKATEVVRGAESQVTEVVRGSESQATEVVRGAESQATEVVRGAESEATEVVRGAESEATEVVRGAESQATEVVQ